MAALARRFITVLLTTVLVVSFVGPAASAASYESEALALLNEARAGAGLAPVAMSSDLTDDALAWSQHMQGTQTLSHNPNLSAVAADWDKLGENVGVGTSVESLHQAFMDSSSHRGNILGDYNYVGIAVVEETASKLWITFVFMKSLGAPAAGDDDPEPYAEEQPPAMTGEPQANPTTDPAPKTTTAPPAPAAPEPVVPVVGVGRSHGPIVV
jgi:hypothetical protein